MENNKERSKEPFPAENTPTPPQVMDPSKPPVRDEETSEDNNSTVPSGDSDKKRDYEKPEKH